MHDDKISENEFENWKNDRITKLVLNTIQEIRDNQINEMISLKNPDPFYLGRLVGAFTQCNDFLKLKFRDIEIYEEAQE